MMLVALFALGACGGNDSPAGPDAAACPTGLTLCDGACVDTDSDRGHCGACGTACEAGFVCNGAGTCELTCQAGLIICDGGCIDPDTDRDFCGATLDCQGANAGTACSAGELCSEGACALTCSAGTIACGGGCIDPDTDSDFCGATLDCQGANAGVACDVGSECLAGTCTATTTIDFVFTGGPQAIVVPEGVTSIRIDVWGAQGGAASNNSLCSAPHDTGGLGGHARGTLAVTPGETLHIFVGGAGGTGASGGFNGGGIGCSSTDTCASGGGASDVRQGGNAVGDRVIVAGGGGGAEWSCGPQGNGGHGGGLSGADGVNADGSLASGRGGTQTAGGTVGTGAGGSNGSPGALGQGGASATTFHAGGGGGGYYGGGGGGQDGHGGGGSSYLGGVTNGVTTTGVRSGDGLVRLSW
jgi:hypothetical protein